MSELSIIIPVFNCLKEATIPCINSIEVSEDVDLIIVDNGSTDSTEQYFRDYAKEKGVEFEIIDGDTIFLSDSECKKSQQPSC